MKSAGGTVGVMSWRGGGGAVECKKRSPVQWSKKGKRKKVLSISEKVSLPPRPPRLPAPGALKRSPHSAPPP